MEAVRSMIHDQDISMHLWVEAARTIVYVQNRTPHRILENKTPEEVFSSKKPEVGHLRIFACPVHIHIPKEKRKKLDPSGRKGMRWLTYGFLPKNTSSYVLFSSTLCGVRFCTYTAILAASSHRGMGISWSWSIALATSVIVLFFLSATPFCYGLYGVVNSLLIPESLHNSLNSFELCHYMIERSWSSSLCGSRSRIWIPWNYWILHPFVSKKNVSLSSYNNHQWKKHNIHTHLMN